MNSGNILNLQFLAQTDPAMFKGALLSFSHEPFKKISQIEFENKYQAIIHAKGMTKGLKELFNLYLLTHFLVGEEGEQPSWTGSFLADNIDVEKYLGLTLETAQLGSWCYVPVVFTGNNTSDIRLFVIGLVDEKPGGLIPPWARPLLSDDLLQAVETATQVAMGFAPGSGNKFLLCFPLAITGKTVQFKGTSLGLPLALGFTRILTARPGNKNLVATGCIETDGSITQVGYLKEKIIGAESRFDVLLYPFANDIARKEKTPVLIPVANFKQAWMFFSLYSEKDRDKLSLLSNIILDPKLFAENIGNLPADWISWIHKEHLIDRTLYEVMNTPSLFLVFASTFETIVDSYLLEKGKAVGKLINPDLIDHLAGTSPVAALKWCSANLSLANHLGQIQMASQWQTSGIGLIPKVLAADIKTVVTFYNHEMVFNHNRFYFHKDLPHELKQLLTFLDGRYRQQCDFGCTTDFLAGRLYGTLMQNLSFCGPGHIEDSEIFSQKACKALGYGTTPEFKNEWHRHLSYITLARLDAGHFDTAEQSLKAYLETDRLENIMLHPSPLDPWQYYLLARFFSEVKAHPLGKKFYGWLSSKFDSIAKDTHPWQLSAYNTGRIAYRFDHIDAAEKMMTKSIDICLSDQLGPTIQVMSLLPISLLVHYRKKSMQPVQSDLLRWEKIIRAAAANLDPEHFSFLNKSDFQTALEKLRICPERFFPFTYR